LIDNLDDLPLARCWEYQFLDELVVKRSAEIAFLSIKMVLAKHRPSLERITFHFDQCVEIRPDNIFTLSGLELRIEPHRSPFFEEVRFRVFEDEGKAFEFLCGGFVLETKD